MYRLKPNKFTYKILGFAIVAEEDHKFVSSENYCVVFFSVNDNTGEVLMQRGAAPGRHELTVRVYDDFWDQTVDAKVVVDVVYIDDEALGRTGSVRLEGVTGEQFISRAETTSGFEDSIAQTFAQTMADLLGTERQSVEVLGVVDVPGTFPSHLNFPVIANENTNLKQYHGCFRLGSTSD